MGTQGSKKKAVNTNTPSGINWEKGLNRRGILTAAKDAQWEYLRVRGQDGWRYPLFDLAGEIHGYRWKNMNSKASPKYLWLDNKSAKMPDYYLLSGLEAAIHEADGTLYIANGEPALLSLRSADVHNALCWLHGEAQVPQSLSRLLEQLNVRRVIHFFDKDDAGERAISNVQEKLYDTPVEYVAMHLPERLKKKGDINDWWCACNMNVEHFRAEFFERCNDSTAIHTFQAAYTPAPQDTLFGDYGLHTTIAGLTRQTDIQQKYELPEKFYQAILENLSSPRPIAIKHDGYTSAVRCVFHEHEHDDKNPAAHWHHEQGHFHCFKCGQTWNAISTGEALRLNWRDYIDTPIPSRQYTDKNPPQPPPLTDEELAADAIQFGDIASDTPVNMNPFDNIFGNSTDTHIYHETRGFSPFDNVPEYYCEPEVPGALAQKRFETLPLRFLYECFNRQEDGDVRVLRELLGNRLLFDVHDKCWYLWMGHYWQKDEGRQIRYLITDYLAEQFAELAATLYKRAGLARDNHEHQALMKKANAVTKRVRKLRMFTGMRTTLKMAEWTFTVHGNVWDKHNHLLGVSNGVIDMSTGEHRAGQPGDYIRSVANVSYVPGATAPTFLKFVDDIFDGDHEMVAFMQRLLGYCITGSTRDHIIPIFYGRGRNGKDTLLETIAEVMGDVLASPGDEALVTGGKRRGGGPTPELHMLQGKRMTWVSETSEEAVMNAARMKLITGGGRITARQLYGNPVTFKTTHKVIIQTNHKPIAPTRDEDYALWERLLLIPFDLSFVENPVEDYERQRDENLKYKLCQEKAGILNWLLQGTLDWHQNGLNPPEKVKAATSAYAEEEDIVMQFVDDACDVSNEETTTQALTMYEAFIIWSERTKQPRLLSNKKFGMRLTKFFEKSHTVTGKVYTGIRPLVMPPERIR